MMTRTFLLLKSALGLASVGVFVFVPLFASAQTTNIAQKAETPISTVLGSLARNQAGVEVRADDVRAELQRAPEANRRAMLAAPDTVQQISSNLLVRRVLAAEAQRDGLSQDPLVAAALVVARDRVLSDARLAKIDAQNEPSVEALDAFARNVYKVNADRFERPAQTRASHILLANTGPESLIKAKALLAQLRGGASFSELAKANSIDTGSGARGGDVGYFAQGKMVRPFEDAVAALVKPGDLSEPVESQFGIHIIRLDDRREKALMSYEEVRAQLMDEARTSLMNESRVLKVQAIVKDFVFDRVSIEAMAKSESAQSTKP